MCPFSIKLSSVRSCFFGFSTDNSYCMGACFVAWTTTNPETANSISLSIGKLKYYNTQRGPQRSFLEDETTNIKRKQAKELGYRRFSPPGSFAESWGGRDSPWKEPAQFSLVIKPFHHHTLRLAKQRFSLQAPSYLANSCF